MQIVTLDFESYYSKTYSLSKMTTEEYVNGDEFEVIGFAYKINDGETKWVDQADVKEVLASIDWKNSALLCHNAFFDASILSLAFNIVPAKFLDTLSMARAVHGISVGGSLAKLVEHYELGAKGTEVHDAIGKHREDFAPADLRAYAEYCKLDVNLTYELFKKLVPHFNMTELELINLTIRMAAIPLLEVDLPVLEQHLYEVKEAKEELLNRLDIDKADIMSNPKFAKLLEAQGAEVPMKVSPATGKLTYAFAKTDDGLKDLLEHPNLTVQTLVAIRLGVKSTIEETRTERYMNIAKRMGRLPVPLSYYGAATGRWTAGGGQAVNFQNIARESKIKDAIVAPEGFMIVGADLSNIELRVGLWLAGEMEALKSLGDGRDLYKEFASLAFNVPYDEVTKPQRFIGKTCLAEGTLVLCESGWKPIETVSMNDRVWDGEEWVCHLGLVTNGLKETLEICGVWLTPDHLVWLGQKWIRADQVGSTGCDLSQVLGAGSEKLPLQGMCWEQEGGLKPSLLNVIVTSLSILWPSKTLKNLRLLGALNAPVRRGLRKDIGTISVVCQTMTIGLGCLIGYVRQLLDAMLQHALTIVRMGQGGLLYAMNGVETKGSFLDTYKLWKGGMSQNTTWIGKTTTKDTSRETLDSSQGGTTIGTNGESMILKRRIPVYDLNSVGTRNRFTVLTDRGPIIVHNCQLGLIFGVGHHKLQASIKAQSGTDLGEIEAKRIVDLYRKTYTGITGLWKTCGDAIKAIAEDKEFSFGHDGFFKVDGKKGVRLPSGMYMQYPELANVVDEKTGEKGYKYKLRKGYDRLYGGKLTNNITQGTARCILAEAMVRVGNSYPIALSIHDAIYLVVPENKAQEALDFLMGEMTKTPTWMPGIPLAAEGKIGKTLKEAG